MIAASKNSDFIRQHLVNKPVLLVDPPRPTAGKFVLEWFWLPNARKRFALHISQKTHDTDRLSPITFRPPDQIFKCRRVKLNGPHSPSFVAASSSDNPSPRVRADRRRAFIVSELSK